MSEKIKWRQILFLLSLYSIVALFVRGYGYGVVDQTHYLTFVKHSLTPSLYSRDYLVQGYGSHDSIFVNAIVLAVKLVGNLELTVFIFYLFLLCIFYFLAYKISFLLFKSRAAAWLSVFFLLYPFPIGGSGMTIFETYLTLRVVAIDFLLLALVLLLQNRLVLSAMVAGVGFLFHPLTLFPFPFVLFLLFLLERRRRKEKIFSLIIFFSVALPVIANYMWNQPAGDFFMDYSWKRMIEERAPYIFARLWSLKSWLLIFFSSAIYVIYGLVNSENKKINIVAKAAIFASTSLLVAHFISDIFSIHFGLQLQLMRNLYLFIFFSFLYLAHLILTLGKKYARYILFLTGVSVFLLSIISKYRSFDFPFIQPRSDQERAADWAKKNTAYSAIFAIPPNHSGFRFFSERNVIVEYKEGAESLYSKKFALEWKKRQELLLNYYQMDGDRVLSLKKILDLNYFLTSSRLPFPVAYQNSTWTIYDLRGF